MIIRDLVKLQGWKLTGVKETAADVTLDGAIDLVDISKIINYLVYREWDYTEITSPDIATIEVIGEKEGTSYLNEAKIRIRQAEGKNNVKTTYKISGGKTQEETEIEDGTTIIIRGRGKYTVTAYTYGEEGNRSRGVNKVIKIIEKAPYTVEHYHKKLNGIYELAEREEITGTIDAIVTANAKSYAGYLQEKNINEVLEGIVVEDGSLILKIYYGLETYTINYNLNGGTIEEEPWNYTIDTKDTVLPQPTRPGYTFAGWTDEENKEPEIEKVIEKGTTGDKEYTAHWIANTDTIYRVQHYLAKLNGEYLLAETEKLTSATDETVIAKPKAYEGYLQEKNENEILEGIVTADESLILKIYYGLETYTISYNLNGGTIEEEPWNYTIDTEDTVLPQPTRPGYTFAGWTDEENGELEKEKVIEKGTTGDKEYTAHWIANTDTIYRVQHYKENLDGTYTLDITEELKGTTDEIAKAITRNYTGFIQTQHENQILEGRVTANQDLVLKVYYARDKYKYVIKHYYNNREDVTELETLEATYGETINKYNMKEKNGYTYSRVEGIPLTIGANTNEIKVYYGLIQYNISYNLNGGTLGEELDEYTIESENIILKEPTKQGYTFIGWTGSNGDQIEKKVTIEKGTIGNKEYTAHWSPNTDTEYSVEYYHESLETAGTYKKYETIKYKGTTDTLVIAKEKIYEGFTKVDYEDERLEGIIAPDGSLVLKIYYTRNEYTYKVRYYYNNVEDSQAQLSIKVKYGATIDEATRRDRVGYSFGRAVLGTGTYEIKVYYDLDIYNISYNLDGGTAKNPTTYNIESDEIRLVNPTRAGYIFEGWTGSNGNTLSKEVKIASGSIGDKEYTAHWTARADTPYRVEHYKENLNGTYTVDTTEELRGTTDTKATAKSKTYTGFTQTTNSNQKLEGIINGNGSLVLKVYYKMNTSRITINPNGGSVSITSPTGGVTSEIKSSTTYTQKYTTTLTYTNPVKTSTTAETNYTVTYNAMGGNISTTEKNTKATNSVVTGYTFSGWTKSSPFYGTLSSTTSNGTYTFPSNDGVTSTITATYTRGITSDTTTSVKLPTPTKAGYTFKGWYTNSSYSDNSRVGNNSNEYIPSMNITLYAKWEREIYVTLYTDGTLAFTSSDKVLSGKTVEKSFGNIYGQEWEEFEEVPWYAENYDLKIKTVNFVDKIYPQSTKHWFDGEANLTTIDNIGNLDTSNVTNMYGMFAYCYGLTSLDLSTFDTSKVTDMGAMFHNSNNLVSITFSEKIDTSKVTDMKNMFRDCTNLKRIDNLDKFNTIKVTSTRSMFNGCSSLTSLNLSNFNTSNVTDMSYMFYMKEDDKGSSLTSLTSLNLSSFNTSQVTDMSYMFNRCSELASLNLSSFNTSKVTNMSTMFQGCSSLTSLNLPNTFNTSKVADMSYMFNGCSGLTSLNLPNTFNTSQVTNMSFMFSDCSSLTSLNLSAFNTSSVTNMQAMFNGCSRLTSLNLPNTFNTSQVTDMSFMFNGCSSLTSLNLSVFNTSSVTNMQAMFQGCSSLTSWNVYYKTGLNINSFNTSQVTDMSYMFYGCSSLTNLSITNFNTSAVTNMNRMFQKCSNITAIYVSRLGWITANATTTGMFSNCGVKQVTLI